MTEAGTQSDGRALGLLSVCAPVLNEQESVEEFYSRVVQALQGIPFELIIVDDGSSDAPRRSSAGSPPPIRAYASSPCRATSATTPPSLPGSTMPSETPSS